MSCSIKSFFLATFLICAIVGNGAQISIGINDRQAALIVPQLQQKKSDEEKERLKTIINTIKTNPADADAWYVLGLTLNRDWDGLVHLSDLGKEYEDKYLSAYSAFEMAVKLRPNFADAHAELCYEMFLSNNKDAKSHAEQALQLGAQSYKAHYVVGEINFREKDFYKASSEANDVLKFNPAFYHALLLKSQAQYGLGNVRAAIENIERFLAVASKDEDADGWREHLATLKLKLNKSNANGADANQLPIYSSKDVTQKAVILGRADPGFTESARKAGVQGTVRVVLGADASVRDVLIQQSLSYGLTAKAVRAAHKIKFQPAMFDGKPVSQYVVIEYSFNFY
ncbi:MAG: hypothetical protein NVSMB56_15880 [Pyrinomonadaceae bacterium]